jgi:hypothetical protein
MHFWRHGVGGGALFKENGCCMVVVERLLSPLDTCVVAYISPEAFFRPQLSQLNVNERSHIKEIDSWSPLLDTKNV